MASIVWSGCSLEQLRDDSRSTASASVDAITSAIEALAAHPLVGRRVEGEIRELVISYGQTGYIALYRFVVTSDEVRVLALRHQREIGFRP